MMINGKLCEKCGESLEICEMTPEQFVKRWLPEYETKLNEDMEWYCACTLDDKRKAFIDRHFPAALAAYTDHIRKEACDQACEKQREECAEAWHNAIAEIREPYYESIDKVIRTAPAPEFKITEKE